MNKNFYALGVLLLTGVWLAGTGFFLQENGISLNWDFSPNYAQRPLPVPAPVASAENFLSNNLFAWIFLTH
ncbi:MAG: hypothetical protein Q8P76_04080 [bacterium]|nr:hypothetical protein [bacterium]